MDTTSIGTTYRMGVEASWYGTTVTKEPDLKSLLLLPNNCNTFVSVEPLLGDLHIMDHEAELKYVNWVIIGAETGKRKDKVVPEEKWIKEIVEICKKNNIPVFMKSSLIRIWNDSLILDFPKKLNR